MSSSIFDIKRAQFSQKRIRNRNKSKNLFHVCPAVKSGSSNFKLPHTIVEYPAIFPSCRFIFYMKITNGLR
ncbi:hypothetical protein HNY73_008164 [Argiope bruennichi]|uniref:Uncharacterized protein n=1 Tax=Argiope bruennichi TaxID=94029 RepID=A0A8T0FAI0_ARGBR|nr:hypothetical protein HNY73_008164 [Argiope bruennichi]